ncbi:CotH kinase family protein [Candidatus Latescibacterota bacterium]
MRRIAFPSISPLEDEDGDYPDWIELYNPGESPIDLSGYGLSDNPSNLFKCIMPDYILNSKEHFLIFASGKDIKSVNRSMETIITHGDVWNYFIGVSEPPSQWNTLEFDDSAWLSGPSGFGYYNDDDATIIPRTVSLYLRKSFGVDDITNITECFLHIDYDDAFVAYINGREIARANIGLPGISPAFDQVAAGAREALMYQGGNPEEYQIENIQSLLVPGENVLAIQVHNLSIYNIDMSAIPFLTFAMTTPPVNPRGVPGILISYTYFHTNFKISATGETITLTDTAGNVCDQVDTGYIPMNISRGRNPDGGAEWIFFEQPTPGESNNTPGYRGFAYTVQVSIPGGFYDNDVSVELSSDSPASVLRYTLDGSDPIESSEIYSSPISINETKVLRARVFETGLLPGNITTHTYFIYPDFTLPVISLSTDPFNLWDEEKGIYVAGSNFDSGDKYTANYWKDWERPVHVEFYEPDGTHGFSIDGGVKIAGKLTRPYAQKSLAIFARSRYGYDEIKYQIFPDLPITEFKSFVLRISGEDWFGNLFRDAMMQSLVKDRDMDIQAYRPAVVYINGEYWGIQNIREKMNEDYIASHHGVDPDNIDLLQDLWNFGNGVVIEGDNEHYYALRDYILNNNMGDPDHYKYVKTQMQIESFIDIMAAQIYFANTDGPGHNMKYWREKVPGSKLRWMLIDTDFGYAGPVKNKDGKTLITPVAYNHNTLTFDRKPKETWTPRDAKFPFNHLLANEQFKYDFINRYADCLNTCFSPDFVIQRIRDMKAVIEPEMPHHLERWEGVIGTMSNWHDNVAVMEYFAEKRTNICRTHVYQKFGIGTALVEINVSNSSAGKVKINSITINGYPWEGTYFTDVPIKITALPEPGYRFTGWTGITPSDSVSVSVVLTGDLSITANFEKDTGAIVINEINYNSSNDFNPGDWVELYNSYEFPVDLSGWVFKDEDDTHSFAIHSDTVIEPDGFFVLCRDSSAFAGHFPDMINYVGDIGFGLGNGRESLRLFNAHNALVDSLTYDNKIPWPGEPDGTGATLALINPGLDNSLVKSWTVSYSYGTPGKINDVFIVGVDNIGSDIPAVFSLGQNYPNPFNPTTTIPFSIPSSSSVTIEIYSILGQSVETLLDEYLLQGHHSVIFKAEDIAAGVYFYTITAGKFRETRQMLLIK